MNGKSKKKQQQGKMQQDQLENNLKWYVFGIIQIMQQIDSLDWQAQDLGMNNDEEQVEDPPDQVEVSQCCEPLLVFWILTTVFRD